MFDEPVQGISRGRIAAHESAIQNAGVLALDVAETVFHPQN